MGNRHRYEFTDWNLYHQDDVTLVYRPSLRTLANRLVLTVLACVFLVLCHVGYRALENRMGGPSPSHSPEVQERLRELDAHAVRMRESLRESMPAEKWQSVEAELQRKRAEQEAGADAHYAQQARLDQSLRYALLALTALFTVVAILPPLCALREQITVARDSRNTLVVTRRRILTRTQSCPIASLTPLKVTVGEVVFHGRHGALHRAGYRWTVLTGSDPARCGTGAGFDFHPAHQKETPIAGQPLPERVATFLEGMRRLTGLSHGEPIILDYRQAKPSLFGRQGAMQVRGRLSFRVGRDDLSELPPELHGEIRAMLAKEQSEGGVGFSKRVVTHRQFTFRDAEGNEHTYTSPEEMPPHVRDLFEKIRKERGLE